MHCLYTVINKCGFTNSASLTVTVLDFCFMSLMSADVDAPVPHCGDDGTRHGRVIEVVLCGN